MKGILCIKNRFAFILQTAPADQGGLALLEDTLGEGNPAEPLRSKTPFVAGKGVDVGGSRCGLHRDLPHALGSIHEQKRML